jgi:hypothetical protein
VDLVIFTNDGSPPSGTTFGKWDDLIAFLAPLQAAHSGLEPRIRFTQSFTVPSVGMPPTGWPMALATWESALPATGAVTVTVPPGVTIDMLSGMTHGIGVTCNPSVDGETFKYSEFPPGMVIVLGIGFGATLVNTSTKALAVTPGAGPQTYFVVADFVATWLTPLAGPIVKALGSDVVIGSGLQSWSGLQDGWAESSSGSALLLYQDGIGSNFPAVSWAGPIAEQFNGTDSLQLRQRNGTIAGRAALAALPSFALKVGSMYFATDLGPNGAPLWWNGTAWVDATGTVVP